jgi:hypothetical protein
MRYYLRLGDKLTSCTVSNELSEYLIVKLGGTGANYGYPLGKKLAQAWINALPEQYEVPKKNVSQWVQDRILEFIVDPAVLAKRTQILQWRAEFHTKKQKG